MFKTTFKIRESRIFVKNLRRLTLSAPSPTPPPPLPYISKLVIQLAVYSLIGLSRLRSATFEHLLRLGASFCGSNNLEQFMPFLSNFSEQGRFRAHIKHEKANDFIENFKSFMVQTLRMQSVELVSFNLLHIVRQSV